MFIGQTIVAENTTGTSVYTPWFTRNGDAMTSVVEIIAMGASARVDITILHKNSEDIDSPETSAGTFTTGLSSANTYTKRVTGLKELVRYKITVRHATTSAITYAHLRMLAPSWESTGAQGV